MSLLLHEAVQLPAMHTWPGWQMVLQSPHWSNELRVAQRSVHSWASVTRQASMQAPPTQLWVGPQWVPQAPQL